MTVRLLLFLIRAYQLVLSPFLGGSCRFLPSCSAYAREAIETHGAWRGTILAARRLARCHPLGRPGLDPVPAPPTTLRQPRTSDF
jgi:putative membrane protein insertion efficiency factor